MGHRRTQDAARDRQVATWARGCAPVSATPEGDWHRRQGVEANNAVYELLDRDRSPDEDEARASYVIARALVAAGQAARGLVSADRALAVCTEDGLYDFDLAYAREARSRALSALGRTDEAAAAASLARAVPIADPEDRTLVERDLADLA